MVCVMMLGAHLLLHKAITYLRHKPWVATFPNRTHCLHIHLKLDTFLKCLLKERFFTFLWTIYFFENPALASFVNFQLAIVSRLFIWWRRFNVSESYDGLCQESYWQARPLHHRKGFIYIQICNALSLFNFFFLSDHRKLSFLPLKMTNYLQYKW